MTARTHDIIAFASLLTVAAYNPPESLNLATAVASVLAADIGALLPDIDSAGNRLWDLLPAGKTLGKVFRRIFYKHRTLTHSLLGVFIVYKALGFLLPKFINPSYFDPQIILVSVMVGYISHLVADSFTKDGLPLLFPFNFDFGLPPFKALRIRTGGWFEKVIIFPAVVILLLFIIVKENDRLISLVSLINS